jgi:Leucine-rich repeat (LRR) protein
MCTSYSIFCTFCYTGSLVADIGNLTNLEELRASYNDFFGILPAEITKLSNLITLDLAGNMLSGKIPTALQDIAPLRTLHLQGQRDFGGFSGPLPSFRKSPHLHDIDLSHNSLTGNISDSFLETVRQSSNRTDYAYPTINLSHNMITGKIPANWDDFVGLFVDLAGNQITEVPGVLCDDDYEFENSLVGALTENKCDAILCRPGYYSDVGRQTQVDVACFECPEGTTSRFYGSLKCESESGERAILDRIYELIFTHASEDQYWGTETPICSWEGLKCKHENSTDGITEISLESNALIAGEDDIDEISKLFFSLPSLEYLSLKGNDVPLKFDNIGNATKLKSLLLSLTGLTSIDGIAAAANTLTSLHLTENSLEGPLMSDILKLTKLEELYISFNQISGPLTGIGSLTKLREFYAFKNRLTGTLPTELGSLSHLEYFVAGQNKFEGTLPVELDNLVKIKDFSVYYQESEKGLGGLLRSFSKATNIEKIDIEGNKFSGKIPSTLLSGLSSDYIASTDNQISLRFAANDFTGVLPVELGSIKNLFLDIAGNQINGPIPTTFCSQSSWMEGLVGELDSCDAIACPSGTYSESGRRSSNEETCRPCAANEVAPFLGSYSCKNEDSEINILKAIYKGTNGSKWDDDLHWNDFSTPICAWYGVTCEGGKEDNHTVTELDFSDNNLRGTILSSIFELPSLKKLNLKDNHVFITFDKIGQAENLVELYLSNIDIGNVDGIGKAPALKELHLTNNDLAGPLPDDIFDLHATLESLYIAYNSFSGPLSPKFGTMKQLKELYAYGNELTGKIPAEIATLENLETFVVAENLLSGSLSEDFSSMKSLKLFSAFRRLKAGPKLHGPLPSFSNLPQLEGLYLDYNKFSGTIPTNFLAASLNVDLVTLSHNVLTGAVPKSLASFDSIQLQMEGNRLTGLDKKFCDLDNWMDGFVAAYECDAIMCPPHTFSMYGRQNSTASECQECDGDDEDTTPYYGSLSCEIEIEEKEILQMLYTATGGDNWNNKDGWTDPNADVCDYFGIECGDGKSVMGIRLGANNLKGTPPREIFQLKQLHVLWLHSNPIKFKFDGIGRAENLIELRLDATGLSDVTGVEKAKSLVKLDLKYNSISGKFPTELTQMESLETLTLTDNDLSGELPDTFDSYLVVLRLGSNRFSGRLKSFSEMEYLRHLDLSENELSGPIPADFLKMASKRKPIEVDLSSNKLTGGLPSDLDGRFDNLVIYARDNKIEKLSTEFCDADNNGWNFKDVALFGCKGLLCPPGTANYNGRQNSQGNPCSTCKSNTKYYGQITCDGLPLGVSPSSRSSISAAVKVLSALVVGTWMVWM